jgi:hypothetical protein
MRYEFVNEVIDQSGWEAAQWVDVFSQEESPANRPDVNRTMGARVSPFLVVVLFHILLAAPVQRSGRPWLRVQRGGEGVAKVGAAEVDGQYPPGEFPSHDLHVVARCIIVVPVDWCSRRPARASVGDPRGKISGERVATNIAPAED